MVNATAGARGPDQHNRNATFYEARRRVPEVVFDKEEPGEIPTLDSWQPTIKDNTVRSSPTLRARNRLIISKKKTK